jgi:hypothetical protein
MNSASWSSGITGFLGILKTFVGAVPRAKGLRHRTLTFGVGPGRNLRLARPSTNRSATHTCPQKLILPVEIHNQSQFLRCTPSNQCCLNDQLTVKFSNF